MTLEVIRPLGRGPAGSDGEARLVRRDLPEGPPSWEVHVLARGRSLRVRRFSDRLPAIRWLDSL